MKLFRIYIFLPFLFFFILFNKNSLSINDNHIKKIENYLNKLNNITSNFIQIDSNGLKAEGKIYLSKPGKLRIEYKEKKKPLIVADGTWLHFFDIELNEVQSVVINKSPAWILLKKKVDLKKDFKIEKLEKKKNKISITLSNQNTENVQEIKLVFSENPLTLNKWIVSDFQEIDTTVSLLKIKKQNKFDPKVFLLVE